MASHLGKVHKKPAQNPNYQYSSERLVSQSISLPGYTRHMLSKYVDRKQLTYKTAFGFMEMCERSPAVIPTSPSSITWCFTSLAGRQDTFL